MKFYLMAILMSTLATSAYASKVKVFSAKAASTGNSLSGLCEEAGENAKENALSKCYSSGETKCSVVATSIVSQKIAGLFMAKCKVKAVVHNVNHSCQ